MQTPLRDEKYYEVEQHVWWRISIKMLALLDVASFYYALLTSRIKFIFFIPDLAYFKQRGTTEFILQMHEAQL